MGDEKGGEGGGMGWDGMEWNGMDWIGIGMRLGPDWRFLPPPFLSPRTSREPNNTSTKGRKERWEEGEGTKEGKGGCPLVSSGISFRGRGREGGGKGERTC